MAMTQKESWEYVDPDSGHWEGYELTEHLALYRLKFKSLTFFRLDVWMELPKFDSMVMKMKREMKMDIMHYFFGVNDDTIGEPCGISVVAKLVYEEDRK